jgi:hypothetical protein
MPLYQALLPHDSFFPNQEKRDDGAPWSSLREESQQKRNPCICDEMQAIFNLPCCAKSQVELNFIGFCRGFYNRGAVKKMARKR